VYLWKKLKAKTKRTRRLKTNDLSPGEYRELYVKMKLGTATEEEKQTLYGSRQSSYALENYWNSYRAEVPAGIFPRKEEVLEALLREVHPPGRARRLSPFPRKWFRYAAILALALLLPAAAYLYSFRPQEISGQGSGTEYLLSDGSRVALHEGATLRSPKKFLGKSRVVKLLGEADFDVAAQQGKLFRIHTPELVVDVLGTQFHVKALPGSNETEVELYSGEVRIGREHAETGKSQFVTLTPGHKATFLKNEERFILDRIPVTAGKGKASGPAILDDQRLDEVADILGKRYGVQVILEDSTLARMRLTMQIDEEGLEEVRTIIGKILPVHSELKGDTLIFSLR
jgi:ferric-dicitrate binding protein FerR (iron transport regulator)